MQRSKLRNIINRAKEISAKKDSPFESFKKSLPMDINDNYRLEAAWKAYGLPSNFQEAKFYGMIESLDGENYLLPSIGYNEDTEEYEYLNKGKENETVAKDIRAWDNDVIPFIKELKLGGYVRLFNEEKDCWTYTKNSQKRELSAEDKGEQVIDSFLEGGNVQKKYTLPEMFLSRNINGISIKYSNPYLPNSFNSQKDVDDFISKYSKYSSWVINDPNSKYKNLRVQSGILRDGGSHEVNIYDDDDSEDLWNLGGIIEDNGVTSTENDKKLASERKTKLNDFLKPYGILFNNSSTQTFKQGGKPEKKEEINDNISLEDFINQKIQERTEAAIKKATTRKTGYKFKNKSWKNCIATATDNYGVPICLRNSDLAADPKKYGFDDLLFGDNTDTLPDGVLILDYNKPNDYTTPGHTIMLVGRTETGAPIYSYSSGSSDPSDMHNSTTNYFFDKWDDKVKPRAYRYIGTPAERAAWEEEYRAMYPEVEAFKQGGQMNVIPDGALHARKNNMELAKEGEVTHKGVPVVDNDGNQQAEIEREEIIFNKEVTEKLEKWYKEFKSDESSSAEKDKLAIEAGKLLAKEIIENTDDRTGLIDNVKDKL